MSTPRSDPALRGWQRLLVLAVLLLGLAIIAAGVRSTLQVPGCLLPALYVDPWGRHVTMDLPWTPALHLDLHAGAQLIAVDGVPIGERTSYGDLPSQRFARAVARAAPRGTVQLRFRRAGQTVTFDVPLRTIGLPTVAYIGLGSALVAALELFLLCLVLLVAGRRQASHAYALLSLGIIGLLASFLDHYTRAALAPLFPASILLIMLGFPWFAYAFPTPPRILRRTLAAVLWCMAIVTAALLLWLFLVPLVTHTPAVLSPRALLLLAPPAAGVLTASLLLRLHGASPGQARDELRSLLPGCAVIPSVLAVGIVLESRLGGRTSLVNYLVPYLSLPISLSVAYALLRHNVFGTSLIFTRRMLALPTFLLALIIALIVACSTTDLRESPRLIAWVVMGGFLFFPYLRWLVDVLFFPPAALFGPTMRQLAARLVLLRSRRAVSASLADTATRWLRVREARVVDAAAVAELPGITPARLDALRLGERVWIDDPPGPQRLLMPMLAHLTLQGVLLLVPRRAGALRSQEGLHLLDTLASLGAVALRQVDIMEQIEALRRAEMQASRADKSLALDALGAEVAHEVSYPLSYFRFVLDELSQGRPPSARDLVVGQAEIERMERMIQVLQRPRAPGWSSKPVVVVGPLARALDLLRESVRDKGISVELAVPQELTWIGDADALVQVLANLLRNAVQAAPVGGHVGVRHLREADEHVIEVWDDGPGVQSGTALFQVGRSHKEGGMGLGLMISHRIARDLGWRLGHERRGGITVFRLIAPVR